MRFTPFIVRLIGAGLLVICGGVVLGISAHIENAGRDFGLKSSTFTYDAFIGAFTLVVEAIMLGCRFAEKPAALAGIGAEIGVSAVMWVLWIASAIATTHYTTLDRSACENLSQLASELAAQGLDQDTINIIVNIFQSACSELHAELAFIWIAFVVYTLLIGYLIVIAMRQKSRGNSKIWRSTLKQYDVVAHSAVDPFADPEGATPGRHAGVAGQ